MWYVQIEDICTAVPIGSFPCCIATLTNCGDTLRIAAASVGNIRPIFILFPPVGGSLGLFIPSTSFPAMYTVLMLFTLKIIENLLTIHALSSRCDRCHVSHGIAARCLSACHRQSVGCHPDTDGATAAPVSAFNIFSPSLMLSICIYHPPISFPLVVWPLLYFWQVRLCNSLVFPFIFKHRNPHLVINFSSLVLFIHAQPSPAC